MVCNPIGPLEQHREPISCQKGFFIMFFPLKKKDIPSGALYSMQQVINWSRDEQKRNRSCLFCDDWGNLGITPEDTAGEVYFLCYHHYNNEKKTDI